MHVQSCCFALKTHIDLFAVVVAKFPVCSSMVAAYSLLPCVEYIKSIFAKLFFFYNRSSVVNVDSSVDVPNNQEYRTERSPLIN